MTMFFACLALAIAVALSFVLGSLSAEGRRRAKKVQPDRDLEDVTFGLSNSGSYFSSSSLQQSSETKRRESAHNFADFSPSTFDTGYSSSECSSESGGDCGSCDGGSSCD